MSPQPETEKGVTILGCDLSHLPFKVQFVICIIGIFGSYVPYGYLQESIFKADGFKFGLYITLIQFAFYTVFAWIEGLISKDREARATFKEYFQTSALLVFAVALSNLAIVYLNYPTKVMIKSSKMIPVMFVGKVWFGRSYLVSQYLATVLLLIGIILFSLADVTVDTDFQMIGIVYMFLSISAEAYGQNLQEKVISQHNCTEREMLFYNSLIGTGIMSIFLSVNGSLGPAFEFCLQKPYLYTKFFILSFLGYIGAQFLLSLIKTTGVFVALSVTTCRKLFTIVLSFVLFPKPFIWTYVVAGLFSFSGIILNVWAKNQEEFRVAFLSMIGKAPKPQPPPETTVATA